MQQPEGYIEPGKEELVCCLKKSLYGLKQSPRCWNNVFKEFMLFLGFVQSTSDPCVFIPTPMDPNVKLIRDNGRSKPVDTVQYQSMVGSLIYAAIATRPDIAQAVVILAQFNSSPSKAHLTAVKCVFWYLKGTAQLQLQYKETDTNVEGYSDADWASDSDDRRSTSGSVFMMSGGTISWTSKKQLTVALSMSESEYIATQEAVWLRQLMQDLKMDCTTAMTIHEDN